MSTRKSKATSSAPASAPPAAAAIDPPFTEHDRPAEAGPAVERAAEAEPIPEGSTVAAEPVADAAAARAVTPPDTPTHYLVAATARRGRWRAGRFWSPVPIRVAHDALDADAWARIAADPVLTVTPEWT